MSHSARKPRLLIVEDEPAIRTGLVDVFLYHGFEVEAVEDGLRGLARARSGRFDLLLLDVMLPGLDGFGVLAAIRAADREQAVILLTARATDTDVIEGLALGADDYVTKPFSVTQLVLRVQAVLRRAGFGARPPEQLLLAPAVRVDVANLSAQVHGQPVHFTRREMELLLYLHGQRGRPVPREELLHKVWGYARTLGIETRTVDIHVAKLRRKLADESRAIPLLATVRGGGWRLDPQDPQAVG